MYIYSKKTRKVLSELAFVQVNLTDLISPLHCFSPVRLCAHVYCLAVAQL